LTPRPFLIHLFPSYDHLNDMKLSSSQFIALITFIQPDLPSEYDDESLAPCLFLKTTI